MKTKTKNSSRGVLAVSIIVAIVLWTLQQALVIVPSNVQASDWGEDSASFFQEKESRQQKILSLRDIMIKSIEKKLDTFVSSFWSYWNIDSNSTKESSSKDEKENLPWSTVIPPVLCIPKQVSDISNDKYQESINRALDHCLVWWYEDGKFHTEKNISHSEMLIIAERAWYRVDLSQWGEDVVTRSEFLRFIDYLQASKQIGLIPWIEFNTIIKRWEYINFLYIIDEGKLQEKNEANSIKSETLAKEEVISTKEDTWGNKMTIADFKKLLNKSLAIPLPIEKYDDKVMMTEEIMKIILEQNRDQDKTPETKEEDSGLWKEAVKTLLNWFMEKL